MCFRRFSCQRRTSYETTKPKKPVEPQDDSFSTTNEEQDMYAPMRQLLSREREVAGAEARTSPVRPLQTAKTAAPKQCKKAKTFPPNGAKATADLSIECLVHEDESDAICGVSSSACKTTPSELMNLIRAETPTPMSAMWRCAYGCAAQHPAQHCGEQNPNGWETFYTKERDASDDPQCISMQPMQRHRT